MNDVLFSYGRGACRFAKQLPPLISLHSVALVLAAGIWLQPERAQAVPYATSLTNDGAAISFRLNESADNVKILYNGGVDSLDLGARTAGLHVVPLVVSGTFEISVAKSSPVGFAAPIAPNRGAVQQISVDGPTTRFRDPRGLTVNTDPASPAFGRVYVAHSTNGSVVANTFGPARTLTDGIYVMNADLSDAVGQGDTGLTGGIPFVTGGAAGDLVSPYRLSVGQDGNLYIADWSDAGGTLWVTDPSVSTGSGFNVLGGPIGGPFPVTATRFHGSIAAAVVEGSLAGGNLTAFVIDEDLQNDRAATTQTMRNTLWRHDIGATLPGTETLPTRVGSATPWLNFASQTMDMSRGANGYFYVNNYRSVGNDRGGLYVVDSAGAELWNSLSSSRAFLGSGTAIDLLRATGGGAVSPRGDFAAVINLETNAITVLPLIDGIPDITNRLVFQGFNIATAQGRDVAFDLAGNLYAISSAAQALRVFSPGGTTTAFTGSDGTFRLVRPSAVTVTVADDLATEGSADTAAFTLTRDGDTGSDLTVLYTLSGSAVNGTDFETNVLSAVIPAGSASVDVIVTAIDDAEIETVEAATLTLVATSSYDVKAPLTASVFIADNEPASLTVTALDSTSYERFPTDLMSFRVQRSGETNSELFISIETSNGTAVNGADFVGTDDQPLGGFFIMLAGQSSLTLTVKPVDDQEPEDTETVLVELPTGDPGYSVGVPGSATGYIFDNDSPDYGLLYSDTLDTDSSASWITRFGANNGLFDAEVSWAFDYSTIGVPPAPHSPLSSVGVFVQVNKTNATAGGSAGINLYPAGQTFSGNYAVRFDMLLHNGTASTTEHALAGLNHSTARTNRVTQSADPNGTVRGGDGLFVAIESDGSNNRDWTSYTFPTPTSAPTTITNRTSASLAAVITAPPYAFAGSPGSSAAAGKTWAEVELGQSNNIVTLKVNNNLIYSFTNTSSFNSGAFMLGMNDQFDSVGSGGTAGNFVLFDNVRVVSLDVRITRTVRLANGDMQIDFLSPYGGSPSTYKVEGASSLSALDWTEETGAVISATDTGYRAVVPANGSARFYHIKR